MPHRDLTRRMAWACDLRDADVPKLSTLLFPVFLLPVILFVPREAMAVEGDFRFGYAGQAQLGFEGTPFAHGILGPHGNKG